MKTKKIIFASIVLNLFILVNLFSEQNNVLLDIKIDNFSPEDKVENISLEYSVINKSNKSIVVLTNTPQISSGLFIITSYGKSNNVVKYPPDENKFRVSNFIIPPLLPNCTLTKRIKVPKNIFYIMDKKDTLIGKIKIAEDGTNGPIVYDIYSQPIMSNW